MRDICEAQSGGEMNESELSTIRFSLLEQKSLILNKAQEFKIEQSLERSNIPDESEAIANELSNNITIHLHERERLSLIQIEIALNKITSGQYGKCEACNEPIQAKRLQIHPFTRLCVECQEDQESLRS